MKNEEQSLNSTNSKTGWIPHKASSLDGLLSNCPYNQTITESFIKSWKIINDRRYSKVLCSVSGGSDSDIMLDICWRCDVDNKINYIWYDTGLEYQATKDHLKVLEGKYGIKINTYKANKPVPLSCREFGQPFCSKFAAQQIGTLQGKGFDFSDAPFDELASRFPSIISSLRWWCNMYTPAKSQYNISRCKWLKEFLIENPPDFKISSKCCDYAKKNVRKTLVKKEKYELEISGIRKCEGGIRSVHYTNCYDEKIDECDSYRPLFWYLDKDKNDYEEAFGITHSKCYTLYGLKRTGCACCPFGKSFEVGLQAVEQYEPDMYKAVNNIFGDSYEYTRKYKEFYKRKNDEQIHK